MSTARARDAARGIRSRLRYDSRNPWLAVALVAVGQAVLVLGPALGAGLVIVYDMAWAPDPTWTPFVLGLDTPAPRAVPSDALAVALGHVTGAGLAQKAILLAVLTGLGLGAAVLLTELKPSAGTPARLAATVASVWNPYVYERLAVGQWTVLVGFAALPWAVRASLRVGAQGRHAGSLAVPLVVAGFGGANSLVIVAASVLPVLLFRAVTDAQARVARGAVVTLIVVLGMSAAWSVPALFADVASPTEGALAFAPTADTPLGILGSLVSGGGFWNESTHPAARQVLAVAVAAAALSLLSVGAVLRGAFVGGERAFIVAVLAPTALVATSVMPGAQALWVTAITAVPGGGLLRDSHKLLAAWVIAMAVGLGVLVELARERPPPSSRVPLSALLLGLPVVLLPTLGWGLGGDLSAVTVPEDYRTSIARVNELPPGEVALMPWNQYRRYDWNNGRVSLTLAPRLITRTVLFNDALPLRAGTVPGESERAARVTRNLDSAESVGAVFSAAGIRYLAVERTAGSLDDEADVRASGSLVIDDPSILVVELPDAAAPAPERRWPALVGWGVTAVTTVVVLMFGVFRRPV